MQQILYNITVVLSQNQMFLLDLLLSCNSERFSSEKLAHEDHAAPVGKCVILLEMSSCKYAAEADILTVVLLQQAFPSWPL